MDWLNLMLSDTNGQPLSPPIKHALKSARALINKYYSKTDMSNVYRIAIGEYTVFLASPFVEISFVVLHPNLKLKYFRQHGWEKAWINTAESITHDEYAKYAALKESEPTMVCIFNSLLNNLL